MALSSYYSDRVASQPRLYPAHALLGAAFLDRARQTYDATDLVKARDAIRTSLEIQPNFEAMKTMAAICNFAHRFQDAITWIDRAADAFPEDTSLRSMRVDALLALGQHEAARQSLGNDAAAADDFYVNTATGNVLSAEARPSEAAEKFLRAASLAEAEMAFELSQWARVTAAGAYLDVGDLAHARPLLEAATKINPSDPFVRVHQAELAEASGERVKALASYELVLQQQDPEMLRRAFNLLIQLDRYAQAQRHFEAAEFLCKKAIELEEVYSLETLANLYFNAERNLDAARQLAARNWMFKCDHRHGRPCSEQAE